MAARHFVLPLTVALIAAVGVGSVDDGGGSGHLIAFDTFPEATHDL
jgi:hypothetical protein